MISSRTAPGRTMATNSRNAAAELSFAITRQSVVRIAGIQDRIALPVFRGTVFNSTPNPRLSTLKPMKARRLSRVQAALGPVHGGPGEKSFPLFVAKPPRTSLLNDGMSSLGLGITWI